MLYVPKIRTPFCHATHAGFSGDALAPTVETLQASALDLLERMIDPAAVTS